MGVCFIGLGEFTHIPPCLDYFKEAGTMFIWWHWRRAPTGMCRRVTSALTRGYCGYQPNGATGRPCGAPAASSARLLGHRPSTLCDERRVDSVYLRRPE
jgi:hypothetical protein